MTPTLRCNQRCIFCWRSIEQEIDDSRILEPEEFLEKISALQRKGLSGDKPFSDPNFWEEATTKPTQFAVSLSGEPTLYPHLARLIELLKGENNEHSVFVVSNGTVPSMIEKIAPTQLYISLDAVDVESYEQICCPLGNPQTMWSNIMSSLSLLKQKEDEGIRTAIRTTLVRGCNDSLAHEFAKIFTVAQPMYIEIKGYMYLGHSRMRLTESSVPDMEAIREFAAKIVEEINELVDDSIEDSIDTSANESLNESVNESANTSIGAFTKSSTKSPTKPFNGYEIMDENVPSRVIVLRRKSIVMQEKSK